MSQCTFPNGSIEGFIFNSTFTVVHTHKHVGAAVLQLDGEFGRAGGEADRHNADALRVEQYIAAQ